MQLAIQAPPPRFPRPLPHQAKWVKSQKTSTNPLRCQFVTVARINDIQLVNKSLNFMLC